MAYGLVSAQTLDESIEQARHAMYTMYLIIENVEQKRISCNEETQVLMNRGHRKQFCKIILAPKRLPPKDASIIDNKCSGKYGRKQRRQ